MFYSHNNNNPPLYSSTSQVSPISRFFQRNQQPPIPRNKKRPNEPGLNDVEHIAKNICTVMFGFEFMVIMLTIVYLTSCYQYNMFYTLGMPPQLVKVFTSLFGMAVCWWGGITQCKWVLRTALFTAFCSIVSVVFMSIYMDKWDRSWEDPLSTQYYARRILYWETIIMFPYTVLYTVVLYRWDASLNDAERMKTINNSPFLRKDD